MSIVKRIIPLLSLFLLVGVVASSLDTPKYVLSQYCNATIPVWSAALFKTDDWYMQENDYECRVTIKSVYSNYQNLVRLQIMHFDADCNSNTVVLYDGQRATGRKIATLCGQQLDRDQKMYLTLGAELTIVVTRQDYQSSPISLRMLATGTSRDYGGQGDYVCNNGMIIINGLCCDGNNNCGDWSDERDNNDYCSPKFAGHSYNWVLRHIGYGVGGGVVLILFIVVVVVLLRRRRRQKSKKPTTGLEAYGSIQGIENPGILPPSSYQHSDVMTPPYAKSASA
ncbi:neuropilin and tolloid-like protein 2 [Littorina saxatilis]|uniref:CUB domain-containing protein n=1 Tax=Littorina saxatilis TaxID=31220 RepID=A0AAN9BYQ0_9CAEN